MSKYRKLSTITHIVIHCADTHNGRHVSRREIDNWHRARNFKRAYAARLGEDEWGDRALHAVGCSSIGYHYVIHHNGTVEVGRRLSETGAHTLDRRYAKGDARRYRFNRHAIAICLIGRDQYTLDQWEALRLNISATHRDLKRLLKVVGHRDIDNGKECPGYDVSKWLEGNMKPLEGHILENL